MGGELELIVTITYGGGRKGEISTLDEAVSTVREDLTVLGIPHPKRANISVVCKGTVRFFWTALPNSAIHKTLKSGIRAPYNELAHKGTLARLLIETITLNEKPATLELSGSMPKPPTWKPQLHEHLYPSADLYAMPMSGSRRSFSASTPAIPPPGRSQHQADEEARQFLEQIASGNAPRPSESFVSGPLSWNRAPAPPINIKSEPPADTPIPPPQSARRSRFDVDEEMPPVDDSDSHRRSSTSSMRIDRQRYAAIPDPSPRPAHTPEVRALQSELRDVRKQLLAELDKERAVLQTLRDLGVEDDELAATPETDFVTKARIQQLEDELQEERQKRRRLEGFVGDVRRECRAPFVVPALLDAFIEISRLTNEALEDG